MANNVSPDDLYRRSREDLLQYEDSRMNSLLQGIANFYTTRNDQSTWGNLLRSLAIELAKLDYNYSYAIVNKDPSFLTPPDISRRWRDPLYVTSNWPSKTQFDTDFKSMLVQLIQAYKLGSTVASIQDVIFAYTGINIIVEELYKEIGNGVFDQSDRNSIKVSVSVGNNSLSQITTLTQLQQIVQSLYGAIDLAKPAHVGLEFTTVFGQDENIDCFITPEFVTEAQFNSMAVDEQSLYALTGYSLITPPVFWMASTVTSNPFDQGTLLRDSNGNLQLALNSGKPGLSVPIWSQTSNANTTDNQITWKNISPQPTSISLTGNVVTVVVANIFTIGTQVTLLNLAVGDNFSFLNGQKLTVTSSNTTSFTASFTHANVASHGQSQGTVSFIPAAEINLIAFLVLSPTYQSLYQAEYTNTNCSAVTQVQPWFHPGIDDTLRIFIKQVEQPPFDNMLVLAPFSWDAKATYSIDDAVTYLNSTYTSTTNNNVGNVPNSSHSWFLNNAATTVAGYGERPPLTLQATSGPAGSPAAGGYNNLPSITFSIINTSSDGTHLSYSFNTLSAPGNLPLHDGMKVAITNTTNHGGAFNITGVIEDVQMLSMTSGTFLINAPIANVVAPQVETGQGLVTPTLKSAYVSQAGAFVLQQASTDPAVTAPNKWVFLTNVDNAGNIYYTGEVSNWDFQHPIGLVAPRLDQVWEIGGDQDFIFGLT